MEEEQRSIVVERCYWPLLRLARKLSLPFGIEASGYSLEQIARIDPAWIEELCSLATNGQCEFIGCGYTQIIGPLVPADVNQANLRLGMETYDRLLALQPAFALINEQAYSGGLVPLYREAGYQAVIVEWNNPARAHPEWDPEWRYQPQYLLAPDHSRIPLIWNESIAFQKFQRYAHGEIELDEYLTYLRQHNTNDGRIFPLYGNDAECFDFRPGRFMTEAPLHGDGEWQRIEKLFEVLLVEPQLSFIKPSQVLEQLDRPGSGNELRLESAACPVPVKKQDKYNLLRWAVSGRGDLEINTRCWQIYEALRENAEPKDSDWKELCYLWSSDFRTHITQRRWDNYLVRLDAFAKRWSSNQDRSTGVMGESIQAVQKQPPLEIVRKGRFLLVKGEHFDLRFNCARGLALDGFTDRRISDKRLIGTLEHGYFDDIGWGADYYTGHLIFQSVGRPKVTDLLPVSPNIDIHEGMVRVRALIDTPLGKISKEWLIDEQTGRLGLRYETDFAEADTGSLRLGHITVVPEAFDPDSLFYRTHNGGRLPETFQLTRDSFDHGRAVSFLVSTSQAIGMTEGSVELGDAMYSICVTVNKAQSALVGLISYQRIKDRYFLRLALSAMEVDDTNRQKLINMKYELGISVARNSSRST